MGQPVDARRYGSRSCRAVPDQGVVQEPLVIFSGVAAAGAFGFDLARDGAIARRDDPLRFEVQDAHAATSTG
ncbi:hypothetical protein SPHINGOAX6_30192 [Sphingomonas sp. AX6]|nr:hypothetical protein SPHINGOAX6_30192 [Sphingomonas sp. AX6]